MSAPGLMLTAAAAVARAGGGPAGPATANLLEALAVRYEQIRDASPSARAATAVFLESVAGAGEALALAGALLSSETGSTSR